MAKTAEEILKEKIVKRDGFFINLREDRTIEAMQEFAAQEVEAYKERIKSEIAERLTFDNHDTYAQAFDSGIHNALRIIDAVK